ncbi:hypothetical protein RJD40_19350 [Vibrio scophthalmi]|uniref:hypothetical protein n=1 Tax=Vibrio scophthalmi TaxID=45658 RepID=UPI003AB0839A
MNELSITIGIVGSLASIISLFISAPGWKSKGIHLAYALVVTGIATLAFEYKNDRTIAETELRRFEALEIQATQLLETRDQTTSGSAKGFMLASLTFLEKNRDLFPDTYERAKQLCENAGCTDTGYESNGSQPRHFDKMYEGATAMHYLIKGVMPVKKLK